MTNPTGSRNQFPAGTSSQREPVPTQTGTGSRSYIREPVLEPPRQNLKDLEELAGHPTGRGVKATKCPTCHQPVLTGLDQNTCAIRATVDFTPLDPAGELAALLAGRRTYTLDLQPGGNPKLTRRTPADIRRPIKKWMKADIVPAHQCGAPPLPAIPTRLTTEIVDPDPDAPPPF